MAEGGGGGGGGSCLTQALNYYMMKIEGSKVHQTGLKASVLCHCEGKCFECKVIIPLSKTTTIRIVKQIMCNVYNRL